MRSTLSFPTFYMCFDVHTCMCVFVGVCLVVYMCILYIYNVSVQYIYIHTEECINDIHAFLIAGLAETRLVQ